MNEGSCIGSCKWHRNNSVKLCVSPSFAFAENDKITVLLWTTVSLAKSTRQWYI